jgi:hypothetical protein
MSTDEDLLWPSQRADWHVRSPTIQTIDLPDKESSHITERFDAGDIEAAPVQVTTRNHTEAPIRLRSQWDGVALDLDVAQVSPKVLSARAAIRAVYRYHHERRPILVNTISAAIAVSLAFGILVTLALLITFTVL